MIETFTSGSFLTNNTFKLECSISALPKVTVNWLKNNVAIQPDSNIKELSEVGTNNVVTSSLTITSAELLNTGNYTCKGDNQFGAFNHTGTINIYGKLISFYRISHLYKSFFLFFPRPY